MRSPMQKKSIASMIFVIFEGKDALALRLNGLSLANKFTRIP